MSDRLRKLQEAQARTWEQMKEIRDRTNPDGTIRAEDEEAWTRGNTDLDKLGTQIDEEQRHVASDRVDRSKVPAPREDDDKRNEPTASERYERAFTNMLKRGASGLDVEERQALAGGLSDDPEIRALSVGTNSAGGYLVPPGYRDEFIVQMKDYGAVQNVAQVITTDSGQPLQWPTMNDTSNVGRLLAENTQLSETDVVVGTATLSAYVYSSDLTRVSLQLANDAAFDIGGIVKTAHAERIGRITNQHFTTGTGSSQPQGIVTGATTGVTAAGTSAITADELIGLVHSVDPAYRRSNRARFMLSDTALLAIRKLKDGQSNYLWQPNYQDGPAANLLGYPYEVNQDMAVPATGVKSVLFGDFQAGYVIRIVSGIQVITFTERYMDYLQLGHTSFMRADGKTQNSSAYKALTQA
jgi:HK97 family phage major capsid protein